MMKVAVNPTRLVLVLQWLVNLILLVNSQSRSVQWQFDEDWTLVHLDEEITLLNADNDETRYEQTNPRIAVGLDLDEYWVIYDSDIANDNDYVACGKRFSKDEDNMELLPQTIFSTDLPSWASVFNRGSVILKTEPRNLVASWMYDYGEEYVFQIFNGSGSPQSESQDIGYLLAAESEEYAILIRLLTEPETVLAVSASAPDESSMIVLAEQFDTDLNTVGSRSNVMSITDGLQFERPSAAALTNGDYVVAWERRPDSGSFPPRIIQGQVFSDPSTSTSSVFNISKDLSVSSEEIKLNTMMHSRFVAMWDAIDSSEGVTNVFAKVFDSSGYECSDLFMINEELNTANTNSSSEGGSIFPLSLNQSADFDIFVATWSQQSKNANDEDVWDSMAQIFAFDLDASSDCSNSEETTNVIRIGDVIPVNERYRRPMIPDDSKNSGNIRPGFGSALDSNGSFIVPFYGRHLDNTTGSGVSAERYQLLYVPPTMSPTSTPTGYPSIPPTEFPTMQPSQHPSTFPSLSPTKYPSLPPTMNPSRFPTFQPTKFPSVPPTEHPSGSPTNNPTRFPTNDPSRHPTSMPTSSTVDPSPAPSGFPTGVPSEVTTSPTTSSPSQFPTVLTNEPTPAPSSTPTEGTDSPTRMPLEIQRLGSNGISKEEENIYIAVIVVLAVLVAGLIGLNGYQYYQKWSKETQERIEKEVMEHMEHQKQSMNGGSDGVKVGQLKTDDPLNRTYNDLGEEIELESPRKKGGDRVAVPIGGSNNNDDEERRVVFASKSVRKKIGKGKSGPMVVNVTPGGPNPKAEELDEMAMDYALKQSMQDGNPDEDTGGPSVGPSVAAVPGTEVLLYALPDETEDPGEPTLAVVPGVSAAVAPPTAGYVFDDDDSDSFVVYPTQGEGFDEGGPDPAGGGRGEGA